MYDFLEFWSRVPIRWRLHSTVFLGVVSVACVGAGGMALLFAGVLSLQDPGKAYALLAAATVCVALGMSIVCEFVVWDITRALKGLRATMLSLNEFDMKVATPLKGQTEVVEVAGQLNILIATWRNLLVQVQAETVRMQGTSEGLKRVAGNMLMLGDAQREDMGLLTTAADRVANMATSVESKATKVGAAVDSIILSSSAAVSRLENQGKAVADISSLITDVAGRINLLALNASIEAARAGDAGAGFSVVAQEVRKLSLETAQMAKDIQAQVADLNAAANEVSQSETVVREHVETIRVEIADVVGAASQQSHAAMDMASGVSRFCERLDELTHRISDTDTAAAQVARGSMDLDREAGRFRT